MNAHDKLKKIFIKHNIDQYRDQKIDNRMSIFNIVLVLNLLFIASSIGVIIAFLIIRFVIG